MYAAIRMTAAKAMLSLPDKAAKKIITSVGGQVNYQVRYQGIPTKSHLISHSIIPDCTLQRWMQCES